MTFDRDSDSDCENERPMITLWVPPVLSKDVHIVKNFGGKKFGFYCDAPLRERGKGVPKEVYMELTNPMDLCSHCVRHWKNQNG